MYKCECGKEFEKQSSLTSHARFCKLYKKKQKKTSLYKITNSLYKCECGKEFNNFQSLNGHFAHCDIHCSSLNKERHDKHKGTMYWENKSKEELKDIKKKATNTLKEKYVNGKIQPSFLNKHHSQESKNKIRNYRSLKYKQNGGRMNFSINACKFIDELNKKNGWNLQHAMNGGEIICLGYWLDGYDKDLNIVVEYDEPKHYKDVENNILNDKDVERQNNIINELHCKFFRYNEKLNLFYEIKK